MSENKKYNIISTIEDDPPFGDINWCSVSFLTPQKIDEISFFDIRGFKVHNGYTNFELTDNDIKKIKKEKPNHDVFPCQMGKVHSWDDATKADEIVYDNDKLNELEKTRKENIDRIKLMAEQFKNEYKTLHANVSADRIEQQRLRMQQKLYKMGKITKKEMEMLEEDKKPVKDVKEEAQKREKVNSEIDEYFKTDYLDENEPTGLKYGCLTIYSPKHIGGLESLLFKIRGLFATPQELSKRVRKLESMYPNDRIYTFEIGKWCAFSETDGIDPTVQLKQLNYAMKVYLDNLKKQNEDFEKRKDDLTTRTEQEAKLVKAKNRAEKRKEQRDAKKKKEKENKKLPVGDITLPSDPTMNKPRSEYDPTSTIGNAEDSAAIKQIFDFLDDPELRDKFPSNGTGEKMELNVS